MPAFLSFRSVVDPADCDFLGHMNVSRYFAACSDGVFAIQSEMGLTASDMREGRRLSFAVVNVQSNFRAELAAGDAIRLERSIIDVGIKSMTFRHRMFRADENLLAFETVFKCVMFDLEARISRDIPDEVRARASQFLEEA